MEDKGLIFWGTFGLLVFNMLICIFGWFAFNSLSLPWALVFMIPFACGAVYFDTIVIKYFIGKIKEKKSKEK